MVRPGKKSEKPDSLVKQILKKDRELLEGRLQKFELEKAVDEIDVEATTPMEALSLLAHDVAS